MPQITDLVPQKGKKDRVSVFLDGNFVCGLQTLTCLEYHLKIGSDIALSDLEKMQLESDTSAAFERSINYLSTRLKTEKELRDYLKNKGYLPAVVGSVIEKLKGYKYLDDYTYAESYIRTYSGTNGRRKLEYDLSRKGVNRTLIEQALSKAQMDKDACLNLAQKYMKNKEQTRESFAKLSRHLAGRGFGFDEINVTIRRLSQIDLEEI